MPAAATNAIRVIREGPTGASGHEGGGDGSDGPFEALRACDVASCDGDVGVGVGYRYRWDVRLRREVRQTG